jgi:hypothetical protein
MLTDHEMRELVKTNIPDIVNWLNEYLKGVNVFEIEPTLKRLGRGGALPHWYENLSAGRSMPNLDGKTIGSVIEMTLVGVLENKLFATSKVPELAINPAKGVDIPLLGLGVKSPSENYCTSEPFFSAYERVLGNAHDNIVLLTDYQTAKKRPPPVRIQIIKAKYLTGSQIADKNLCRIAKKHREFTLTLGNAQAMKFLQFLCHVNQQSWLGKWLLKLCDDLQGNSESHGAIIEAAKEDHEKINVANVKKSKPTVDDSELGRLQSILLERNLANAIINASGDWVIEEVKDFARLANSNEWARYLVSPLDGEIGMSFALQWRYNFGAVFRP